jgi:hypothetical protein
MNVFDKEKNESGLFQGPEKYYCRFWRVLVYLFFRSIALGMNVYFSFVNF